jgi:hypothetical protein
MGKLFAGLVFCLIWVWVSPIRILLMCNFVIKKYVVTSFKISHIIYSLVLLAIKLTELDKGSNSAHFLNFRDESAYFKFQG